MPEPHTGRGAPSSGAPHDLKHDDLVSHLGELARTLAGEPDPDAVLTTVAAAAVADVPGAEHASVSVAARGHSGHTVVASSELATRVDRLQYGLRDGPCLDTLFDHVTVRTDALEDERRWPQFGPLAAAEGVHSMLSVQLFTDGRNLGALNLFAAQPSAFTDESERAALALAAHAAVALAAVTELQGLRRAVESRDVIGQAKGILRERYGIVEATAFAVLVRYSRDNNRKLVEIAQNVVDHGVPLP